MSTDVRAAHQLGIGHVQAWAAGERRKVLGRPEFARRIGRVSTLASLEAKLTALSVEEKLPERFQHGWQLFVKSAIFGTHLQSNGTAVAAHSNAGAWEQWVLESASGAAAGNGDARPPGSVFISNTTHDVRLSASDDKRSLHVTPNRDAWELFRIVDAPGAPGKYCIATHHGTYLSCEQTTVRQSPNQSGWEQWEIVAVDGGHARAQFDATQKIDLHRAAVESAAGVTAGNEERELDTEVQRRLAALQTAAEHIHAQLVQLASNGHA